MYEKELSVFGALKELFLGYSESGCYPFDRETYEDLLCVEKEEDQ